MGPVKDVHFHWTEISCFRFTVGCPMDCWPLFELFQQITVYNDDDINKKSSTANKLFDTRIKIDDVDDSEIVFDSFVYLFFRGL